MLCIGRGLIAMSRNDTVFFFVPCQNTAKQTPRASIPAEPSRTPGRKGDEHHGEIALERSDPTGAGCDVTPHGCTKKKT